MIIIINRRWSATVTNTARNIEDVKEEERKAYLLSNLSLSWALLKMMMMMMMRRALSTRERKRKSRKKKALRKRLLLFSFTPSSKTTHPCCVSNSAFKSSGDAFAIFVFIYSFVLFFLCCDFLLFHSCVWCSFFWVRGVFKEKMQKINTRCLSVLQVL